MCCSVFLLISIAVQLGKWPDLFLQLIEKLSSILQWQWDLLQLLWKRRTSMSKLSNTSVKTSSMQIMSVSGAGGHPPGAVIDRRPPHFLVVTKLVLTRSRIIGRENVAVIETSADLIRIWMISARWFVCVPTQAEGWGDQESVFMITLDPGCWLPSVSRMLARGGQHRDTAEEECYHHGSDHRGRTGGCSPASTRYQIRILCSSYTVQSAVVWAGRWDVAPDEDPSLCHCTLLSPGRGQWAIYPHAAAQRMMMQMQIYLLVVGE